MPGWSQEKLDNKIFKRLKEQFKDLNINSLRNNVALVSQDTIIYNKSFLDNIKFGNLKATDKKIKEAAKNAGIHDFISASLNGYKTHFS